MRAALPERGRTSARPMPQERAKGRPDMARMPERPS